MVNPRETSNQRLDEWSQIDDRALTYHLNQWRNPKLSTIAFEKFTRELIKQSCNIIDMGAGSGAATF